MIRRPPRSTRTDTLFPYTTRFRSVHAEAVLFVDDRQRQVVEGHALLHQRVGADHDLRLAFGHLRQRRSARAAGDLAGEPGDVDAERFEPRAPKSEDGRGGNECVRTVRSRWSPIY